jgi:hypothetical protein
MDSQFDMKGRQGRYLEHSRHRILNELEKPMRGERKGGKWCGRRRFPGGERRHFPSPEFLERVPRKNKRRQ